MSTSVLRTAPPLLPGVVSWYATPSPPLSNVSAWIVPGSAIAVPLYGVDIDALVNRTQSRLPTAPEPALSKTTRMIWAPPDSVTFVDTVVQDCHPPVLGIASAPV